MSQVRSRCVNRRSRVRIQTGTRMRVRVRMLGSWVDECVWGVDWGVDGSSGRNWLRSGMGILRSWWVSNELINESICPYNESIDDSPSILMSWCMSRMRRLMNPFVIRRRWLRIRVVTRMSWRMGCMSRLRSRCTSRSSQLRIRTGIMNRSRSRCVSGMSRLMSCESMNRCMRMMSRLMSRYSVVSRLLIRICKLMSRSTSRMSRQESMCSCLLVVVLCVPC